MVTAKLRDLGEELSDVERVAAESDEVVVDPDLLDPEKLGPEVAQLLLEVRPGRRVGRPSCVAPAERRKPQPVGEADALHLAGGPLGQLVQEHDGRGDLVRREPRRCEVPELLRASHGAVARDHRSRNGLAEPRMRLREDDCVRNGVVTEQRLLHLSRRDLLAAAVDDLLEASAQEEIAVVVEIALVSRAEPAVGEGLPVRVRVSLVAREDVRPAYGNLADLAGREKHAFVVEHCDLRPCGAPDRAPLALVRRQRVHGHLVRGLGHSVRLEHGRVEEVFERVAHERRQRGRGGADEPELSRARARRPGALQDGHVHRGNGRVPGRTAGLEPRHEPERVESRCADDGRAGRDGRQHGRDEAVDVEERHDRKAAVLRGELECSGNGAGRRAEVPFRQRDELRTRGRARGVEEQSRLRPVRALRAELDPERPDRYEAEARVVSRHELQDAEVKAVGNGPHCCRPAPGGTTTADAPRSVRANSSSCSR